MKQKEFTLTLPHLPSRELMPNLSRTLHWRTRGEIAKRDRGEAYYQSFGTHPGFQFDQATINYEFMVKNKRIKDIDGLVSACKPIIDGIVDAGILPNDDCWHLKIGKAEVVLGEFEQTKIRILAL